MSKHGVSDLDSSNVSRQELPPVHTADDRLHPGLRPAQATSRPVESEKSSRRQPGLSVLLWVSPLARLTAVLPGEPVVVLVAVLHVSPGHLVASQLKQTEKTLLEIVSEIENFKFQKFLLTSILMYFLSLKVAQFSPPSPSFVWHCSGLQWEGFFPSRILIIYVSSLCFSS